MIKREFTIEIRAPLEKVFAYTTSFENFVHWQDGVREASQSPQGAARAGTTFKLKRTFLGRELEAEGVVTELIPGRKCAFKTTAGPVPLSVVQNYEPIPGGTRVTLQLEAQPGGFFKLAEGAMDKQLTAAFESQVKKLKAVLEA